jgi:hypothetical protein
MAVSPVINWVTVGFILALLELFIPGIYLIWFGFAAFAVAVIVSCCEIVFTTQLIWFAVLSAVFAVCGLFVYRGIFKKIKTPQEYSNLNDSAEQYVGSLVTVTEDVTDNRTKVKIGDTYWVATTEAKLHKGDSAKVIGVKDSLILVIK